MKHSDLRVMIVEDDPDMIDLLGLILKRGGYEPVAALGGRAALHKLQQNPVDLVLLDLMMDDMNGWEVLEALQREEALRSIPVLILSARHQLEDPDQTESHADYFEGYVVKPFWMNDLLSLIGRALD
jgi:CheY-like chemotaxis protein